jgi:hypothetical protein
LKYLKLLHLPGFKDTEECDDECITKIEELCQTSTK